MSKEQGRDPRGASRGSDTAKRGGARIEAPWWADKDTWGTCCPGCPWVDQPHKPCVGCGGIMAEKGGLA